MTLYDVLSELIAALGASDEPYIVDWHAIHRWPRGALESLTASGILTTTKQAESIECHGCENHCFMDVHIVASKVKPTRAFVVCEDPEMQDQMGRIQIPLEHLRQWRITALQIAKVVVHLLDFDNKVERKQGQDHIRVGIMKGKHGRKWVLMTISPLTLDINGHVTPLNDSLYFEEGKLRIDRDRIQYHADKAPRRKKKPYSKSTTKQEARRLKTEARDVDIQQAYLEIRKKHPWSTLHTDQWVAKKISQLDIAQECSSERIQRIMKE